MGSNSYYYDVALALPANWDNNVFTYESHEILEIGTLVAAPFGKQTKTGYIVSSTTKPSRAIKLCTPINPSIKLSAPSRELLEWLYKNYPVTPGSHVQHMLPSFVNTDMKESDDTRDIDEPKQKPPSLTREQKQAVRLLNESDQAQILHGITGSGKTRVYLELILQTIARGEDVLVLYPEISLTNHMKDALQSFLPERSMYFYHSKQTKTEQRDTWLAAVKSSGGEIFAGPRSALLLPYRNLGLIIVDEAHDGSYKQDSGSRYNGLFLAAALASSHKAKLVFGSATPPLQETYFLESRGSRIVCMHKLAISEERHERSIEVIPMNNTENRSPISLLSKPVIEAVRNSISHGRQSLLFINKRGTARAVFCEKCNWHGKCNKCDTQLVYHHDSFQLRCHICGSRQTAYTSCPECGHELKQRSPGIKALELDLHKAFPGARVARFDSDNKKADSFSMRYNEIKSGGADIIIGTQIITKGLDLPLLDTVGVLQAESLLLLPDFSSRERAIQQLLQVSGRVGRGHAPGKVFIQTYEADSVILEEVKEQDWHSFYNTELNARKQAGFPPFQFALKIWALRKREDTATRLLTRLADDIATAHKNIRLLGPAPSFHAKSQGHYSWQIVLLSSSRQTLVDIVKSLPKDYNFDLDPISFL